MHTVNIFDVFDTLIARRCVEPRRVLDELEKRAGLPGLAEARLAADRTLGMRDLPYLLRDMWQDVVRTTGIDEATAERLMALEMQIEHEQIIPVVENLAQVRDGDLLLSDSYLPPEIILSLLRKAGLTKVVALVSSNNGKSSGRLWQQLLSQVAIREHLGDNEHSDGRMPSEAGIRAVIYTGSALSPVERLLISAGWEALALLAREVRLANPFLPSQAPQRHLWNLCCELNFPLLYLASLWLEDSARRCGASELFFVSRDCLLWRSLYQRLFPQRQSTYLFASRLCALKPSPSYLDYFRSTWHPEGLIVDLGSTGASWASLFARLGQKGRCRFIHFIDDYAYLQGGPQPREWLEVEVVFRNSQPGPPMNKGVEMINFATHGLVEDVLVLPGGAALPVLAQALEYNPALPQAAHDAFAACLAALVHYPDLGVPRADASAELIRTLAGAICADGGLHSIYRHDQASDIAYHQRLLS